MPIIKIDLHTVSADRNLESKGNQQINIQNNVSIKDVQDLDFNRDGKKGLKFNFDFSCDYAPDFGKIEVGGQVLFVEEEKLISEIKESWDKDKRVPTTVMEEVINAALHKGNIQAIKVAEDINMPSPLPMPKVTKDAKK